MLSRYLNTDLRARIFNWNVVYCYNLLVPLPFGLMETQDKARLGMFTGVAILWYVGQRLAVRSPLLSTAMLWGGTLVALCQLMPIGHLLVGTQAVEWSKNFEQIPHEYTSLTSFLGGLIATCITGGAFMLFSLLIGLMVLVLSNLADSAWEKRTLNPRPLPSPTPPPDAPSPPAPLPTSPDSPDPVSLE